LHADRDELGIFYVWKGVIRRLTMAPFPIIGVSGASYKVCGYISLTCADFLELFEFGAVFSKKIYPWSGTNRDFFWYKMGTG